MTGLVAFLDSWWWLLVLAGAVAGMWGWIRRATARYERIMNEHLEETDRG